jgi:hypothetical protein
MGITYIPMARGFVYLAAVVAWFTRRVLAWRLSITSTQPDCGGTKEIRRGAVLTLACADGPSGVEPVGWTARRPG